MWNLRQGKRKEGWKEKKKFIGAQLLLLRRHMPDHLEKDDITLSISSCKAAFDLKDAPYVLPNDHRCLPHVDSCVVHS
jgi:hypothetical protein